MMKNGLLARALAVALVSSGTVLAPPTSPAFASEPPSPISVVGTSYSEPFGAIDWHDGSVYAIANTDKLRTFHADGTSPDAPTSTTPIPFAWHSDGWWQSDTDAFVVAPDGSVFLRSPSGDHNGGGGIPSTLGWGIGELLPDGTVTPVTPPAGTSSFGGTSESLAMDPRGDGVYLGGHRYRDDGYSYGIVARLPLPVPADQQAASEVVVSADGFTQGDPTSYHVSPFHAADHLHAATQAFISAPSQVDARGRHLYFGNGLHAIERVDLVSGEIETVAGGPYVGWDSPTPTEGASALSPFITVQAGPVADRAGNIFFVQGGASRYNNSEGVVWEVRAADGTLHQVAGGGFDNVADPGDDPLSLQLRTFDITLDPDGNLYLVNNGNGGQVKQIVRLDGVAAADTAPGAPTALAATSGPSSLAVTWSAPDDDGGQAVTSYIVRLHPAAGADVVRTVSGTSTTFTGLTDGASYAISVLATNGRGNGPTATINASPADYQAMLATVPTGTAPYAVTLDASGSHAPVGATYQFFCGDTDTPASAPSTIATASCAYRRGSAGAGWPARVVMRDPATGKTYETTRSVSVANAPETVDGSAGFPSDNLVVDVPAAADGSMTSGSCGAGSTGATCLTVDGARIVLTAAPGTFGPGSRVRIYRGSNQALQDELGDNVEVQNGFAITWSPDVALPKPLMVSISPAPGRPVTGSRFDLGGFFAGVANGIGSTATAVAGTVGSVISAAANAVSSSLAGLWAAATQNLARPNNSAVNDVAMCGGELKTTLLGYTCEGHLAVFRGVPTDKITALDARSGVVAAGGANVVAAGGGNVVAAGGANLTATLDPGAIFHLNAASVVAAGGLNVIAPGGANLISDNGLGVVASGGANVVAAGGLNLTAIVNRDPGFVVVTPGDPATPTITATLDPPVPPSGVYPFGTEVSVHVQATAPGSKSVQNVRVDLAGATRVPHTLVAGSSATALVSRPGTTTVSFGATDDQLAESEPGSVEVTIAAPSKPDAPSAVQAVRGSDRQSLTVSWTAPGDHGDLPLTDYVVTGTDVTAGSTLPGVTVPASASSTVLAGLMTGHRYRATVVARSDAGDSAASAPSAEVTLAVAPQAPSGLTATGGDGSVALTWTATADDGGLPASYDVQRGSAVAGPFATVATSTSTTYTDDAVTNGTTYYYVVRAVNDVGDSAPSTPTSATPAHPRTAQIVSFAQPADRVYGAADAPLTASASSGLPVVLTSLSTSVCSVTASKVRVLAAGLCRIEAGQPGNADVSAAPLVTRQFTVRKAPLTVSASSATMVAKGKKPAVAATYRGFVHGDGVRDLAPAARCSVDVKKKVTSCGGVGAANYAPTYRNGKMKASTSGYAIISTPVVYPARGSRFKLAVKLDGGPALLSGKGVLPPGIKIIAKGSRLAFTGTPTAAGSWRVKVSATVDGAKVASQVVTLVVG